MNREEFWAIVEVGSSSNEPEAVLKAELRGKSSEELEDFQKHFDELFDYAYRWDLWGAAYIIGGGCSDDGFIDFRYGLISKGKYIFEKALSDPDSLADIDTENIKNEMFGYVAGEVHEDLTGKEMPPFGISEEGSMGEEWDFDDEEENMRRLPRLMEKYW